MNYELIADAVAFYRKRGYVYVPDAPWTVERAAYHATKPMTARDISIITAPAPAPAAHRAAPSEVHPVASGEQSFIQMMLDGQHLKRAVCVTPCWRAEPKQDTLHRPYFMKAELINAQDVDEGHLVDMVHDACSFFERFFSVRVIKTGEGYDIVEKGTRYELGSYGIRTKLLDERPLRWVYGTGCAEPRLSIAIQRHEGNVGR